MANTPLQSNFAQDGTQDTAITLAIGAKVIPCTLGEDLSETEINSLVLSDTTDAPRKQGVVVIGQEIIYYGMCDKSDDPPRLYDLIRGQDGTTPAAHVVGAEVTIYGPARFGNPAIPNAIMATQATVNDLLSIIADLQARVTALEGHD